MNLSLPTSAGGSRPGTAPAIAPLTFDMPFEVKELLWEQIKRYLKSSEVEEIKRILGRMIIEENEISGFCFRRCFYFKNKIKQNPTFKPNPFHCYIGSHRYFHSLMHFLINPHLPFLTRKFLEYT